jgi:hypothetical protein
MRTQMTVLLIFALFLPIFSSATEVVLLGGGGDHEGPTTIFDSALKSLGNKVGPLGFHVTSCFNGGHSKTEEILSKDLGLENKPFTSSNYNAIINDYAQKISSGKIKRGEKLLICIDTHGAEKDASLLTHPIAMSGSALTDYSSLSGTQLGSLDQLSKLTKLAKEKGIKLGIIDFSCHSGNSLSLANENTCVISSSGTNHYGYSSFAEQFYANMDQGKSLEDVFLKTRSEGTTPSFPMISTRIGKQLNDEEYPLFSPYLNTVNKAGDADKLGPYLRSVFEGNNACVREQNFGKLMAQLEEFQKTIGALNSKKNHSVELIEVLKSYKKDQDDCIEALKKINYPLYEKKETISYGHPKPLTEELSWRDIMLGYPESSLSYFQGLLKESKKPEDRRSYENTIDKFKKISEKRAEIQKAHPELLTANDEAWTYFKAFRDKSNEIYNKASQIADLSNQFYDHQYRERLKQEPKSSEPCRDFKL